MAVQVRPSQEQGRPSSKGDVTSALEKQNIEHMESDKVSPDDHFTGDLTDEVEAKRIRRKIDYRLMPLLVCLYVLAYLDRVNISFAALTMNADLGITPAAYGWVAGILFLGYFAFGVPSNVLLQRFGPRRWLSAITIAFGSRSSRFHATTFLRGFVTCATDSRFPCTAIPR